MTRLRSSLPVLAVGALAGVIAANSVARSASTSWRDDPAWHSGKAEWALYDAERPIYGTTRRYEATLFTNKQQMDPSTTTKAADWRDPNAVEVFKHNLSEMIETEHYTYRFLTTSFVRADTLEPYKVVASTQEDCGTTFKKLVVDPDTVTAEQFCYFPGPGEDRTKYARPRDLALHDALSLTLRDYPFDAARHPKQRVTLVPDQTDTHRTSQRGSEAVIEYVERTTVTVPYGAVDAHHLRVTHERDGGVTETHYWFAADPALRRVMVRY
ncbi:MAG: hypothetical protein GY715_17200, partial [Planctomycetes bacterium]|nr:hypothetical protein [Planctomycetota bacterium]